MNEYLSNALKLLAQGGTSIGTGLAGAVPSTLSLLTSGLGWLDKQINEPEEQHQEGLQNIKSVLEYATPSALQGYLSKATGGYLEPQTTAQKAVTNVGQTIGSMVGLGAPLGIATKAATLGTAAKHVAKYMGLSDEIANLFELGGMASSGLLKGTKNITNLKNKVLYPAADIAVQSPVFASAENLKSVANSVIKAANTGLGESASGKSKIIELANKIISKIKNNKIVAKELWEIKKDLYDEVAKLSDKHKKIIKPLVDEVYSTLDSYGKVNPIFGYNFKNADILHSVENSMPIVDKGIDKLIGKNDKSGMGDFIRKALVWGHSKLKGLIARNVINSIGKRAEAFIYSPAYRKEATRLAMATTKSSIPAVNASINKLIDIKNKYDNRLTNKKGQKFNFVSPATKKSTIPATSNTNQLNPGFKFLTKEEVAASKQTPF